MFVFAAITAFMITIIQNEGNLLDATVIDVRGGTDYIFPGNYANLSGNEPSKRFVLESDIIDRNVVKAFLVHGSLYEEEIMTLCDYEASSTENIDLDSLEMECFEQFYNLQLNGQRIYPDYYFAEDPNLERKGLVAYLDIAHLPRGMHKIKLYYNLLEEGQMDSVLVADVEFFKTALPLIQEKALYLEETGDIENRTEGI
jgi:hypothetical protein